MDADARELALEMKVAELEQRLHRLEQAAASAPTESATASAAATSATAGAAAPPPSAAPPQLAPAMAVNEPEWLRATRERAAHAASTYERAVEARRHAPPAPAGRVAPPNAAVPASPAASSPGATSPAAASATAPSVTAPGLAFSLADLEARLTGRALAWVGGLALVLGAIFFLSLAFTRGWIGPEARVIIGVAAGALSLGIGALLMDRGNRLLGHVLTPVGLAVISISLVGATRLFGLIPVELGLLLALASSIAAAAIAIRADSPIVAAFGQIAVLAAPPLLGASPDLVTLAFVAVVLIGTTAVSLWRSWPWLPMVAFVLAAPQVAFWIVGAPDPLMGLSAIALFWLVNLVAAAWEEVRRHRDDLSASSATLMLANAAFLLWAGFTLLDGDLELYRGLFLVVISIAHLGVGFAFVRRDGDADLFGLLAIGTGLAALAMAAPIQFGASAIPIAWTAEAVALAWVAARRGHPYSAAISGLLFILAGAYLVTSIGSGAVGGAPMLTNGQAGSLAFFIGGTAVGLWFLRDVGLRSLAAAYAITVVALCALLGIGGVGLSIALTSVLVIAAALPSIFMMLPDAPIQWRTAGLIPPDLRSTPWRPAATRLLSVAMLFAGLLSTAAVIRVYGPSFATVAGGIPFIDAAGGALLIYLAGLAAVAALHDERQRELVAAVGLLVTAWVCARALDGVAEVVGWSVLVVAGFALWRGLRIVARAPRTVVDRTLGIDWTADMVLPVAALSVAVVAALRLMTVELPFWELVDAVLPSVPFTDAGSIGALSLAAAAIVVGLIVNTRQALRWSAIAAGAIVAYLVPFEIAAWAVVVAWVGLAVGWTALIQRDAEGRRVYLVAAMLGSTVAAAFALDRVAPLDRLVAGEVAVDGIVAMQSLAALAAVTIALAAIARVGWAEGWGRWVGVIAGASFVYMASVALVDVVAILAGGSVPIDELRTWGQVGLSVLWAVLGVVAFVGGMRWRSPELRHAGLVLLGLATLKVFMFDLSALDVAYRVISLIALGLLLLASAGLWQRNQPGRETVGGAPGAPEPDDVSA